MVFFSSKIIKTWGKIIMKINFVKMHGLGNDFILIDCLSKPLGDSSFLSYLAKKLCNRNFGIGADGLILILPSSKADLTLRNKPSPVRDGPDI